MSAAPEVDQPGHVNGMRPPERIVDRLAALRTERRAETVAVRDDLHRAVFPHTEPVGPLAAVATLICEVAARHVLDPDTVTFRLIADKVRTADRIVEDANRVHREFVEYPPPR